MFQLNIYELYHTDQHSTKILRKYEIHHNSEVGGVFDIAYEIRGMS